MARSMMMMVALLVPAIAAAESPSKGALDPLVSALDDARQHAASLADYAATAPPARLTTSSPDEDGLFSAVVSADQALSDLLEDSPSALPRDGDIAILTHLNATHDALAAYARARTRGDRRQMTLAARRIVDSLARAEGVVQPSQPPQP